MNEQQNKREERPQVDTGTPFDQVMKRPGRDTEEESEAARDLVIGGLLLVVGIGLPVLSLLHLAFTGSGFYVFVLGITIPGAIRFSRGWRKLRTGRE
jgi:hypothetical protein